MKYIVMCGGTFPKFKTPRHLLEFNGEPIVARTIRLLRENGIDDIAISADYGVYEEFGVPLLRHDNDYCSRGYNMCTGHWCDAFYPTNEPTCYLFGDVVYSPNAIKKIIETETDDIAFFGSKPPFASNYPKKWIEPYGFKVVNTDHLHQAVLDVKRLEAEGKFKRKPIAWEVWNVISRGADGDVNTIDYNSYVAINDWSCDIDKPEEIRLLETLAKNERKK